jgi:hypothetical protein
MSALSRVRTAPKIVWSGSLCSSVLRNAPDGFPSKGQTMSSEQSSSVRTKEHDNPPLSAPERAGTSYEPYGLWVRVRSYFQNGSRGFQSGTWRNRRCASGGSGDVQSAVMPIGEVSPSTGSGSSNTTVSTPCSAQKLRTHRSAS